MIVLDDAASHLSPGAALVVAFGAIPVLFFILHLLTKPRGNLPPGNLGLPFVGEMHKFVAGPLQFSLERAREFGTPFLTSVFFRPTIELAKDEDVKWLWEMERKGVVITRGSSHIRSLMGDGNIIASSGARHRALRRLMGPAFAPTAVRDYLEIVDRTTRIELEKWASSGEFHSSFEFKELALRLLFKCVFPDVSEEVMQEVHHNLVIWFDGFHVLFPFAFPGTALSKGLAARKRLLTLIDELIEDFKNGSSDSEAAKTTLLGRLIFGTDEQGNRLDNGALSNHILTIIFAGHDTTYATLGSLLHNIASNESVMCALTEEVSAKNFKGAELDFGELKNAPILNAVLAESWRKDPPVIAAPARSLLQGVTYKQWEMPTNMAVQYNIDLCSYNEKRYPQPAEFRIERFLPPDHPFVKDDSLYAGVDTNNPSVAYTVFGGGTHSCLGYQFARLEARVILTRMFQRYKVEVKNSKKVEFFFNTYHIDFRLTPKLISNGDAH